jgi:hypothetical protein
MLLTATPVSVVAHQGFSGVVVNYFSSPKSILDPSSLRPLPPNLLVKKMRIRVILVLNVSCVAAPQTWFSFQLMLGTAAAISTGPVYCNPTQYLNAPATIRMDLRMDSEGSPNKGSLSGSFMANGPMWASYQPSQQPQGITGAYGTLHYNLPMNQPFPRLPGRGGWFPSSIQSIGLGDAPAGDPPCSGPTSFPLPTPPSVPQPGNQTFQTFDTGVYNTLDLWAGCNSSDFGNSIQVVDYLVECMSPLPSITVPDTAVIPI